MFLLTLLGCLFMVRYPGWDVPEGWFVVDPQPDWRAHSTELPLVSSACSNLPAHPAGRPIWLLVPGVLGDGPEWDDTVPMLAPLAGQIWIWRWYPNHGREALTHTLSAGIDQLRACAPDASEVVVLSHSGGGNVAAWAVADLHSSGPPVHLITVAAPLAGEASRESSPMQRRIFMADIWTTMGNYPEPSPGVRVTEYRTAWPPDNVMAPWADGFIPNDPGVRIPGAEIHELPGLDHDGSVAVVIRALLDDHAVAEAQGRGAAMP